MLRKPLNLQTPYSDNVTVEFVSFRLEKENMKCPRGLVFERVAKYLNGTWLAISVGLPLIRANKPNMMAAPFVSSWRNVGAGFRKCVRCIVPASCVHLTALPFAHERIYGSLSLQTLTQPWPRVSNSPNLPPGAPRNHSWKRAARRLGKCRCKEEANGK